jgi:hypothetical protein
MAVKPIPEGYHSVTPYLCVKGAAQAIEFYKKALSASERMRIMHPDGRVGHAEVQIGDFVIMLSMNFRRWAHAVPRASVDAREYPFVCRGRRCNVQPCGRSRSQGQAASSRPVLWLSFGRN